MKFWIKLLCLAILLINGSCTNDIDENILDNLQEKIAYVKGVTSPVHSHTKLFSGTGGGQFYQMGAYFDLLQSNKYDIIYISVFFVSTFYVFYLERNDSMIYTTHKMKNGVSKFGKYITKVDTMHLDSESCKWDVYETILKNNNFWEKTLVDPYLHKKYEDDHRGKDVYGLVPNDGFFIGAKINGKTHKIVRFFFLNNINEFEIATAILNKSPHPCPGLRYESINCSCYYRIFYENQNGQTGIFTTSELENNLRCE